MERPLSWARAAGCSDPRLGLRPASASDLRSTQRRPRSASAAAGLVLSVVAPATAAAVMFALVLVPASVPVLVLAFVSASALTSVPMSVPAFVLGAV